MTPARILEEYDIAGVPKKLIAEMREHFAALEADGAHPWRILLDEISDIDTQNVEEMEDIDANRLWVAQACAGVLSQSLPRKQKGNDSLSWDERIENLKRPEDINHFFALLEITEYENSSALVDSGYEPIYRALIRRFGTWNAFLEHMGIEQVDWSQKISDCETGSELILLFQNIGLTEDQYTSSKWLKSNQKRELLQAINSDSRFPSWQMYLYFLGLRSIGDWSTELNKCKTAKDVLELAKRAGIPKDKVVDFEWQKNSFSGLLLAILKDQRFGSRTAFREFLGLDLSASTPQIIATLITKDDFCTYFKSIGIPESMVTSSHWLRNNGYTAIPRAIVLDQRFGGKWENFRVFMANEKPKHKRNVESCKTVSDFVELFSKYNIPSEYQFNARWLQDNGFSGLHGAIIKDMRFKSWKHFKLFMGNDPGIAYRVTRCINRSDFIKFLSDNGIDVTKEECLKVEFVRSIGLSGLVTAIVNDERFQSWSEFLNFMNPESIESDAQLDHLSNLNLEEAIALLGNDPYALKMYIQHAHAELDEVEIDRLVTMAFRNFMIGRKDTREQKYLTYSTMLPEVVINYYPLETDEPTLCIEGTAQGEFVYLTGVYTRKITIQNGRFNVTIPLKIGEENAIGIMAVDTQDTKNKVRSEQTWMTIEQTQEPLDDVDALFILLDESKEALTEGIRKNPGRLEYFTQCSEQLLIKRFARSFTEGEGYMEDLIAETESATIRKVLNTVLAKFRKINRYKFANVQEGTLLFFQKYCAYEIRQRMKDPACPGVILGNDPGTGKTRTIQAAIADLEAGIIAPNSVVSTWEDEAIAMLEDPDLLVMQNMPANIRKERLRTRRRIAGVLKPKRYVTNREFLQQTDDKARFKLLGSKSMVLVHDEAHSRINETSKQSMGASMIDNCFQINISATPAKNAEGVRKMLRTLLPKDPRFASKTAFSMAFPVGDPQAMKVLNLLLRKYMIRFRKRDVIEEIDPTQSLSQQLYRLPRKEFIPTETTGRFTMSEGQADAIYQMFLNWDAWSKKYDKYIPDDETSEEDRLRVAGALTRRHAMRQSINNPEYLGLHDKDAKAAQVKNIVSENLKEGRKVVIFCAYNAQANKYAKMFKHLNPAVYSGETSKEKEKKDQYGKPMKFAREIGPGGRPGNWKLDPKGYPLEDPKGETMLALDYERIVFQNTADSQIIIATYQAGAVGTTFTAGKAMIFDDLPTDVVEAIQAEDRIQRIDPLRQTHAEVKYYSLVSQYPKAFLENMKRKWVVTDHSNRCFKEFASEKKAKQFAEAQRRKLNHEYAEVPETAYDVFFEQGTYDQVHSENLGTQRKVFHLINDGIADDSILTIDQIKFKGFNGVSSNAI